MFLKICLCYTTDIKYERGNSMFDNLFNNLQLLPGEAFTAVGSVAEKTIDKVAEATGWIMIPKGNHKNQLEAEEYLIEQIKNDENMPSLAKAASISKVRKLIKEYLNQQNILSIAMPYLTDNAKPEMVDDDWMVLFFDKAKNVSKEELAIIWGKILAGEINTPGKFSKSLIHILSIIDSEEALIFQKVANFSVTIGEKKYVILFDNKYKDIYSKVGLKQEDILKLIDIGLVQHNSFGGTIRAIENVKLKYFDYELDIPATCKVAIGNIILSKAAEQLLSLMEDKKKVEEFKNFLPEIINSDNLEILL